MHSKNLIVTLLLTSVAATPRAVSDDALDVELLPNPSFEEPLANPGGKGWTLGEHGHDISRDFEVMNSGNASLRFASTGKPLSSGAKILLPLDDARQNAFELSGHIRSAGLTGGAALYALIKRENGERHFERMANRTVSGDQDWREFEIRVPSVSDAVQVEVGMMVWGDGIAWFDDLELEMIDTDIGLSEEADAYLTNALDIMQSQSIVRDDVDWPEIRQLSKSLSSGAVSPNETYNSIEFAIKSLGDDHSFFTRPRLIEQSEPKWSSPAGQMVGENIAYVSVPSFNGQSETSMTKFADEIQKIISALDSATTCGWVVDLRQNSGGNVFPMLAGLGPLIGNGEAGGGITADGNLIARTYLDGRSGPAVVSEEPYTLLRTGTPIAILLSERTASSGEATALAFVGLKRVRTFGSHTSGATTGNATFLFDDGAKLHLAVTKMIDRSGKVYGGKIEPDVLIEPRDGGDALAEATSWLRNQDDCR